MENNPYAPPVSSIQGTPELVREDAKDGFRDLSGITGKVSILLLVGLGLKILAIVSLVMQVDLLSHSYTRADLLASAKRLGAISVGTVVLYLVTVVVFGRWIYLAQRNLPELGARLLRYTPGWSVGCFFIPLINLWAPCQAMNQLVRASRNPRQWELEDTPAVIVIWWILWLIVQFLGNGVLRASIAAKTTAMVSGATQLDVVFSGISVPLYVLAWVIVRRVARDQLETHAQQAIFGQTAAYQSP
jgi:Domain of unknown function (DUF4328)